MERVSVYVGNYGSGKTEIALNEAFNAAPSGPVTLVDLDIVNPYFRSSDRAAELKNAGIEVVSPSFAGKAVDLPSLSAAVYGVFERQGRIIFDVGGDPSGAAALGRYHEHFEAVSEKCEMLYIINARRPLSTNPDDIEALLRRVEERARLLVTGIVNNTNLARDTRAEDVLFGQDTTLELSGRTGLPICSIYAAADVIAELPEAFKKENGHIIKTLVPRMRPEWLDVGF